MIKKLLAIVLLLHIGLVFAQNSPPPSPFSFQNGQAVLREDVLQNAPPLITDNSQQSANPQSQNNNESDLKPIEQSQLDDLGKTVTDTFEEKMTDYGTKLIPYTLRLFYTLLILSLILTVVTQMILGSHFKDIITSLVFIFFVAGFFILLIENWIEWSNWIVKYFVKIGTSISDVNLQPSEIIKYMMKYINRIYEKLSFTSVGQSLMYIILAIPTFFLIIQMVAVYIFALFEFIIIGKLSVIYLAFAGIKFTAGYAKKPLMYCLACGLKLMFLQLFFGGALSIIADFSTKQMSIQLAMVMFICSVILNLLVQKLPQIVDSFIHGTTSATMGGNLHSMTKALSSVAMGTAKAVMNAMDSKKLIENASKLASANMPSQQVNERMEQSYQKHRQDILSKQNNSNASASNSLNPSNQNISSAKSEINSNSNALNANAKNSTSSMQNKSSINANNNTPLNNKSNANIAVSTPLNQPNQDSLNKASSINNNNSTSNSNTSSILNKVAHGAVHGVKTAAHAAGALIRNDFNLDKANQSLDTQLYKKQAVNGEQERLWDRIYSGHSPENYPQAQKYIEHGNKMEKDSKYASQFMDYVNYRKQIYQDSENQLQDFSQDANSIIQTADNQQHQDSQEIKKDTQ
jgi:P-type conjugative transfer protein TrbL